MGRIGLVVLFVFLLACTVATTPASTTTAVTTTTTALPADALAGAEMFRSCMSAAGYEVGEIPVDADGSPSLAVLADNLDATAGFRQALTDCSPLLVSFLDLDQSPGLEAMVRDQLSRYAECMRASGVEDFPEPAAEGANLPFSPEEIPVADPEFNAAIESCAAAMTVSP